jgi:acetyltransferase-like isoleucine patch superfamily enzyme
MKGNRIMLNTLSEPDYIASDPRVVLHKNQRKRQSLVVYLKNILKVLIHLNYKTIRFNFKYLKFSDALKFPFFLKNNVVLDKLKGNVKIPGDIQPGMVRIGYGDVGHFDSKSKFIWSVEGNVVFKGGALLKFGSRIVVGKGAYLEMGDGFRISPNSVVICYRIIVFGSSCRVSWDVQIMDTDFHRIRSLAGDILNPPKEIIIGDRVWIGAKVLLMKGTKIGNDCVIAANSLVTKEIAGNNQIIGGIPGKIIKTGITWDK